MLTPIYLGKEVKRLIQFNNQQLDAIRKAIQWYFTESDHKQIFALGGLAG